MTDPFVAMSLVAQHAGDVRSLRQKGVDDPLQVMPPRPLNNFGDFTALMHDSKTLPPGQSAFTLAVPYVFDMTADFTPDSLQAMKDGLRAQLELGLQVLDAAIKGEVLDEKRIIVPGN